MKKFLILILTLLTGLVGQSQIKKVESHTLWYALYPSNRNFDNENRLIRKVNIDYDYNKVTVPDYFTYENMQAQSTGGKRSRRHKKYRRRNKTKHYNRQIKRYTKKYRIF
jgi:hypothetical protein